MIRPSAVPRVKRLRDMELPEHLRDDIRGYVHRDALGALSPVDRVGYAGPEGALVAIADGIAAYVEVARSSAPHPDHGRLIAAMLDAWVGLLDLPCGRLDTRACAEWASYIAADVCGLDMHTDPVSRLSGAE